MIQRRILAVVTMLAAPLASQEPEASRQHVPASLDEVPRATLSSPLPGVEGKRFELAGGAVAYLVPDSTLPLVDIAVAMRVGSFLDPPGKVGLASFTGAMVRRGGTTSHSADTFDEIVDTLGLRIDSSTGIARGGASLTATTWVLDEALQMFAGMLQEPSFQQDRVQSARRNLLESMRRRNQDAVQILEREWEWLLYGRDHFSTAPLTPSSVAFFERDQLAEFHSRTWRADRMIFAVSGDFDLPEMVEELNDLLRTAPEAEASDFPPISWPPPGPDSQPQPGLFHVEFESPQTKVALGKRIRRIGWEHPDRFTLEVLREVLGGTGAISRLGGRLRTAESLVYRVALRLDPGDLWDGDFQVFFDTRGETTAVAIQAALEEVERLRSGSVHPRELEVVKTTLRSKLRLRFDTAEEIAGYFAEDEMLARPHGYWSRYRDAILAVTSHDIQRVAQEYLDPETFQFLVVGPWDEISAGAPKGHSRLETFLDKPVEHLPARDPSTMSPLAPK